MQLNEWTLRDGRADRGRESSNLRASWHASLWRPWRRKLTRAYGRAGVAFSEWFAWHGNWISHHQRRTVLLCNLVIASLFYPAVVLYLLTTSEDPASTLHAPVCVMRDHIYAGDQPACVTGAQSPTNIWDVVKGSLQDLTGYVRSQALSDHYPVHDLRLVWDETPTLEVVNKNGHEAPVIHVAQVLMSSDKIRQGAGSPYGVLSPSFLMTALALEKELDAKLLSDAPNKPSCVRRNETDTCLVLSPLEYWHRNAAAIKADPHPAKSYTGSPIRAIVTPPVAPAAAHSPLPLLYSTTLAGRWPFLPLFSRAEYLVLTYFLHDSHMDAWPGMVREAMERVAPATVSMPRDIAAGTTTLEFKPQSLTARPTINYKIVVVGYLLLLLYIFRGLVQMRRLHSRFGMAFTGSVQLIIDLIMSLSLCALLGIRLTAVPWPILPFIIVVVGSETMLFVIHVVTNTPLSLTVNSRIAYGLSQVAGPITFSTATDVLLLGVIGYVVRNEAVTQFVLFTMCALVADYFMQMTFFITVLSIDIQRLELAEVLMQGTRAPSAAATPHADMPRRLRMDHPRSGTARLVHMLYRLWCMRSPRLVHALAIVLAAGTALVMYAPQVVSSEAWLRVLYHRAHVPPDAELDQSPYGAFWRALNPDGALSVRVVLEPWILATTTTATGGLPDAPGPWLEGLFYDRRGTTIFLFFLFVVGPIALTMVVLSFILHYLLQHSDKLESWHQDGENIELRRLLDTHTSMPPDTMSMHLSVHADELHTAPILVTAASGTMFVSADTHNALRLDNQGASVLWPLAMLRTKHEAVADASHIVALAVKAGCVAIGQYSGRISVWHVDAPQRLVDMTSTAQAPIQHLAFHADMLLSLHRDGSVRGWLLDGESRVLVEAPESGGSWTCATVHATESGLFLGAASSRGHLAVYRIADDASLVCLVENASHVPLRCAALLPSSTTEQPAPEPMAQMTPPRKPTAWQRSSAVPSHMLVGGDQDGVLHAWQVSECVSDMVVDVPLRDGAIRDVRAAEGMLWVQTTNRVWLVEPSLRVRDSIANPRGCVDITPDGWLLGLCRAYASEARWEIWRAQLLNSAVERISVDIESLIRAAVRDSVEQGLHPPSRLPLLTARVDRMVRRGSEWMIPFGSTILSLKAEHM